MFVYCLTKSFSSSGICFENNKRQSKGSPVLHLNACFQTCKLWLFKQKWRLRWVEIHLWLGSILGSKGFPYNVFTHANNIYFSCLSKSTYCLTYFQSLTLGVRVIRWKVSKNEVPLAFGRYRVRIRYQTFPFNLPTIILKVIILLSRRKKKEFNNSVKCFIGHVAF